MSGFALSLSRVFRSVADDACGCVSRILFSLITLLADSASEAHSVRVYEHTLALYSLLSLSDAELVSEFCSSCEEEAE